MATECILSPRPGGDTAHRRRKRREWTIRDAADRKSQFCLYTTIEGPVFERLVVRMQQPWTLRKYETTLDLSDSRLR